MVLETFTYCTCRLLPVKLMFKAVEFLPSWLIWDSRCFCFSSLAPSYSRVAGSSKPGRVSCAEVRSHPCGACCLLTCCPKDRPRGCTRPAWGGCSAPQGAATGFLGSIHLCPQCYLLLLTWYLVKQVVDQDRLVGAGQVPAERHLGISYAFPSR